jgi:pilus assembly protein Flp/PilA
MRSEKRFRAHFLSETFLAGSSWCGSLRTCLVNFVMPPEINISALHFLMEGARLRLRQHKVTDMRKGFVWSFLSNESGATSIEYALIAGIVSICIVAGLTQISATLQSTFTSIGTLLMGRLG